MPVPTTFAVALPLMVPMRLLLTIAALAGPPRNEPVSRMAKSMNMRPPPETSSAAEKNTK